VNRPDAFEGSVILVWPKPVKDMLPGYAVTVLLVGGKNIPTVTGLTVHVSCDDLVWAELTMWTDADGHPLYGGSDGEPLMGAGGVVTGTFPFLVAEMRVAG
jgi:hypothetical protein